MSLGGAAALLAALSFATPARADNAALANALFDEGKRLMQAGKYGEACTKFADSQRLDPGVGTILNLAACYEKNGQMASAWSAYRAAAAAARDKGQTAREQAARESVARLEPGLAKVIVTVTPQPDDASLNVMLDGVAIPTGLRGLPTPIDAGNHKVEASGTGKKPWSKAFTVTGAGTTPMIVPLLENAQVQAQAAPPAAGATTAPASGQPMDAAPRDGKSQRTVALIVGGIGVVGVGVGTAFGLMASSANSSAEGLCNARDMCTPEGSNYRDSAISKAAISTVAFSVGGAALLGGAILWITAPRAQERGAQVSFVPAFSPDGAGLFARGSF